MTTTDIRKPSWQAVIVIFLALSAVLLVLQWSNLALSGDEVGDLAANSLLIQRAKSLHLLVGNYSRVGFNHPGPAILYVLAFGEIVFHDALGIVSPVGGQMLAASIYNAGWITMIAVMGCHLADRWSAAFVFVGIFAVSSAFFEPAVFEGLWFPYLYYMPFATFVLALAFMIVGEASVLAVLAISAGFLINGHVSFVAIVAVMLCVGLLTNLALARFGILERSKCWFDVSYLRTNLFSIVVSLVLGLAFLIPLALETLVHPPGPIPDYYKFASQNPGNGVFDSVLFLLSYIGGGGAFAFGAIGTLVLWWTTRRSLKPPVIGVLLAICAATIATFVYAKTGVDDLRLKYVAIFYYAVPSLTLAVVALMLCTIPALGSFRPTMVILTAMLLVIWVQKVKEPSPQKFDYNHPELKSLYQDLKRRNTYFAIDLDQSRDWPTLWSRMVGLKLYGRRRGEDIFCINDNWHILFTKAARCTPEQLNTSTRLLAIAGQPELAQKDLVAKEGILRIYRPGIQGKQ